MSGPLFRPTCFYLGAGGRFRPIMGHNRGGVWSMGMRWLRVTTVVIASFAAESACAEAWVAKMFAKKEHNFGTVARGADTVYRFPVKNIYKEDIELVNVRSSCGCTTPTLEKKILKTGETGYVVASFNTRTFTGVHSATLTVEVKWNDKGIQRRG